MRKRIRAGGRCPWKNGNQDILFVHNINIGRGINIAGSDIL